MMDSFINLTYQEAEKKVDDFFNGLEYLDKIRILLRVYPGYSITKIEERKIPKLWKAISLIKKKEIYQDNWKY